MGSGLECETERESTNLHWGEHGEEWERKEQVRHPSDGQLREEHEVARHERRPQHLPWQLALQPVWAMLMAANLTKNCYCLHQLVESFGSESNIVMIHGCRPAKWRGLKHREWVPTKSQTSIRKVKPSNLGAITFTHTAIHIQAKLHNLSLYRFYVTGICKLPGFDRCQPNYLMIHVSGWGNKFRNSYRT
jgi:hypothetical protein